MKRKSKSFSLRPIIMVGTAIGAYNALKKLLGLEPGAEAGFFEWTGPTEKDVDVGSARFDLPILYYRDDSFMGVFHAAYEPVRELLPSAELYPVRLPGERAAVAVAAFNYIDTSVAPYGEIGIVIPCTYGRPGPPLLPMLLEGRFPDFGMFVLHLPVTSMVARDGGRVLWGYTKFIANMDFQKRPAYQRVRLTEGDAHILTLTVQAQGLPLKDNRSIITYSVLDDQLLKTTIPSRAFYQMGVRPGAGTLELGDHPIADQLRSIDISTTAFVTRNYLTRSVILPRGEPVGPSDRPHAGHLGEDRDFARFTVNYDDARGTVDLHQRWLESQNVT